MGLLGKIKIKMGISEIFHKVFKLLLPCRLVKLKKDVFLWCLKEASAIPFAALTAWRALKGTAAIKEGYF